MADDARHPRPDLSGAATEPVGIGFFELLRRLEGGGRRFGRAGGPEREPARLGQGVRLAFATRDVSAFTPGTDSAPPKVDVEVIGLFGPEGPMPLHMTRWIMERLSERWFAGEADDATSDTAFLDFANALQHRMIALYWRAWADARPEVQIEQGPGGRMAATVTALAGLGLPGMEPEALAALARLKRVLATSLGQEVHGPERLARAAAAVLGAPVELVEFVGEWVEIPAPLQTRLGGVHARLGVSAVAGARIFQRQGRAELRAGPLSFAQFRAVLEDPSVLAALRHIVLYAAGREIAFDLRPVLARAEVPEPRLGACRIGRTLWLAGGRGRDADDLRLSRFADAVTEAAA